MPGCVEWMTIYMNGSCTNNKRSRWM